MTDQAEYCYCINTTTSIFFKRYQVHDIDVIKMLQNTCVLKCVIAICFDFSLIFLREVI